MDKRKQTSIQEIPKKEKNSYNPSAIKRIFLFGLPSLGVIFIFFIWFELYTPKVIDDWFQGAKLVDSATKTADPIIKKYLMDRGGLILKKQVNLHPYHARVWLLYGQYFSLNNIWDSCIYAEKKAIEIGAGGVVNNIEYMASDNLNYALGKKLTGIHNLDSSIKVIDDAITPNFENSTIYKFKGFTYYNYNQIDSCIVYLERFYSKVQNDFDVLDILAFSYSRKGIYDKALFYATEAKKIKNDNPGINKLINQLNSH